MVSAPWGNRRLKTSQIEVSNECSQVFHGVKYLKAVDLGRLGITSSNIETRAAQNHEFIIRKAPVYKPDNGTEKNNGCQNTSPHSRGEYICKAEGVDHLEAIWNLSLTSIPNLIIY